MDSANRGWVYRYANPCNNTAGTNVFSISNQGSVEANGNIVQGTDHDWVEINGGGWGTGSVVAKYWNNGVSLYNAPGTAYKAVRSAGKYKYFEMEANIYVEAGGNHYGMFWGLDSANTFGGNNETGYRTTHQSSTVMSFRTIRDNYTDYSFNPGGTLEGEWHHQKITATPDGYIRIWFDGVLRFELSGYIPSARGYIGFSNYATTSTSGSVQSLTVMLESVV